MAAGWGASAAAGVDSPEEELAAASVGGEGGGDSGGVVSDPCDPLESSLRAAARISAVVNFFFSAIVSTLGAWSLAEKRAQHQTCTRQRTRPIRPETIALARKFASEATRRPPGQVSSALCTRWGAPDKPPSRVRQIATPLRVEHGTGHGLWPAASHARRHSRQSQDSNDRGCLLFRSQRGTRTARRCPPPVAPSNKRCHHPAKVAENLRNARKMSYLPPSSAGIPHVRTVPDVRQFDAGRPPSCGG